MSYTPLFVKDYQGTIVALQGDLAGELFAGPYSIRDVTNTASVSLTTGTNTTLLAGVTDRYLDLVEITASNNSTVAASVVIKNDGTSVETLRVAANDTMNLSYHTPIPGTALGALWSADMEDITGTTVDITAIFKRSVSLDNR